MLTADLQKIDQLENSGGGVSNHHWAGYRPANRRKTTLDLAFSKKIIAEKG